MSEARAQSVLFVHGIGWGEKGDNFAESLQKNIGQAFEKALTRLHLRDVNRSDAQYKNALHFKAAYWSPITQVPENELIKLLKLDGWWLTRAFSLGVWMRRQMVSLLGDVIAYEGQGHDIYDKIHDCIKGCVDELCADCDQEDGAAGPGSLTVIGHSLGSVIASDYLYDHMQGAAQPHHMVGVNLALKNMILLGSPMALYALRDNPFAKRDQLANSLTSPVQVDPEGGLWLNFYDPNDPISFPLKPIHSYAEAGVIDYRVRAGNWLTAWNPACHLGYFRSSEIASIIGRKLALDWAGANSPSFADRCAKAVESFKKELRQSGG